jgi:hypothetical protein
MEGEPGTGSSKRHSVMTLIGAMHPVLEEPDNAQQLA